MRFAATLMTLVCLTCWPVLGQEAANGPRNAGRPAGRHRAERVSVPGRPQGGGEPAGKLDRPDEVRQPAVGQGRRRKRLRH